MTDEQRWALLAYRLPREPSTPRITLWRRLRQLEAVQLLDNLAALPLDSHTREQLDWLAEGVIEAGGEASVWLAAIAAGFCFVYADDHAQLERESPVYDALYAWRRQQTAA